MKKIGIIGCGLIGWKRAIALKKNQIVGCFDLNKNSATKFAKFFKCKLYQNINDLIKEKKIDIVFICTIHKPLHEIALKVLKENKHMLIEKPGAINLKSLIYLRKKAIKKPKVKIHVGYNHRYHPSVLLAKRIVDQNKIGKLMYIRARYGHGARLNYNKEWRMKKKLSGGGELIDQGSHLIDLSRLFLGNLDLKYSKLNNFFWKTREKIEDNAFLILENRSGNISSLHCSCTEWKNKFSFEIFGKTGKLELSGLGGSYGVEKLIFYKMKKRMGKPSVNEWIFPKNDNSWKLEVDDFFKKIKNNKKVYSDLNNSIENMKIIYKSYKNYL